MGAKKNTGRQPKDIPLKVRLDQKTAIQLDDCTKILDISKSEAVRRGIRREHEALPKANPEGVLP